MPSPFFSRVRFLLGGGLGLWILFCPAQVKAAERYYLIVFGIQKTIKLPKDSHTCALFIKDAPPAPLETVFISWLPEDLHVTILRMRPQVGINLDLHSTLQHFEARGCRIAMWGPYEMNRDLYQKARTRRDILEGGTVDYLGIDRRRRPMAADCIHGVSGVDVEPGLFRSRSAHGDIASYYVLEHLSRWLVHPEVSYPEVAQRLGLDQYCIHNRDYCDAPRALLPILLPYYDTSNVPEGPRGVEAPVPSAAPAAPKASTAR